ncbi:L-threonine dehydratase [Flexivirga endophytica]|uniref:L-threonine dehydratase n=1 Tax=Flexivirga endophytica TaxID=1849103 RepID=A0A916T0W3_9MICO|nr:threonine ammonia-lyase IlvA [Flexivirga endophytica]GGB23605.1 L-threonine dehydratase [Flexivirga endophytica]GHB57534.1 L-threonine dehydratase [Flexivirga endophytica]
MPATAHRKPRAPEESGDAGVVARAATDIEGLAVRTLLQANARLGELVGAQVLLKREDLQPVRSYKIRGAVNLIRGLSQQERERGIVCASAGNHAQGVALACAELGVTARIYLPRNTPRQKRDRVASLGGEHVRLILHGDTYDDASKAAILDASRTGATLAPAFDDPRVIAGQGTVTREILQDLGHAPDILLVPVGGGGLLAGALLALAEAPAEYEADKCRVIAVEPVGAASLRAALDAGQPLDLGEIDTFADGTAVRKVGDHPFEIIRRGEVEVVSVETGAICQEMLRLYQVDGIIAEPSGAMAMADLDRRGITPGATVVAILSGGNNDVSRYAEVIERALVHEGRKHYLLVDFPQEPGALRRFLEDILGPDDDITFFEYVKRNNREFGPAMVGVELGDPSTYDALLERAEESPLEVEPIPLDSPLLRYLL